ncbi:MAG: hypothetical protein C4583_11030 [Anaerolineaceae bacterium]|nr:MAG: hypothetical protein C4583_11030 [Anaerolineaceae bacterium]
MLKRLEHIAEWVLLFLLAFITLTSDSVHAESTFDRARAFTRPHEFNFDTWTADAAWLKLQQSALGLPNYVQRGDQIAVVMESLRLTEAMLRAAQQLEIIFADPTILDKEKETEHIRAELRRLTARQDQISLLAESVIQAQVTEMLAELGLTLGGQPTPPVLYHVTPLPMNLIISRRDRIEQINAISLQPGTTLEEQIVIENGVAQRLDVSTLVVPVGGIGTYPTMVMRTDYFTWQVGVVIHEWTHNFLTLRPLGMNYGTTPELRTMNETAASIVENEIGPLLLARFYPTLTASRADLGRVAWNPDLSQPDDPPPFDFRAEMHTTRVRADELLATGKIEEAEAYMETRRQFFWDNGYAIRKLNQAYFAFYGAYADIPGGPAGKDPVGPAVRALREQSASLANFLYTIAWMDSYEDLLAAIGQNQ